MTSTLSVAELIWLAVVLPGFVLKFSNLMDAADDRAYASLARELRDLKKLIAAQHIRSHTVLCAFSLLSLLLGLAQSWTPDAPLPFDIPPPLSWVTSVLGPLYLVTEIASTVHSVLLRRERKRLVVLKLYDPPPLARPAFSLPAAPPVQSQPEKTEGNEKEDAASSEPPTPL